MWCLITENYCFLQSKMTKRSERGKKILTIVAENSSFCEQFPTSSDFRSLQNFEKLSFKEELFFLIRSFRNMQWWTILFSAKVWISYTLLNWLFMKCQMMRNEDNHKNFDEFMFTSAQTEFCINRDIFGYLNEKSYFLPKFYETSYWPANFRLDMDAAYFIVNFIQCSIQGVAIENCQIGCNM